MHPSLLRPDRRSAARCQTRPATTQNRTGIALAALLLGSTVLPGAWVTAAPQVFSRAGAGISNMPLQVAAFANPAFGDVADAVNLATGNVYLDSGGLNRNNLLGGNDDTKNIFGNAHVNGVLRLAGFNSALPTIPNEWSVAQGDGSFQHYERVKAPGTTAYCVDTKADVIGIAKYATGSGSTEVHVLSGADNYQSFLNQTRTAYGYDQNQVYKLADWNSDGRLDLFKIQKQPTGSGKTEVHILSGTDNFKTVLGDYATGLGLTDDNWDFQIADYNRDGKVDLVGFAKENTGTRSTEVHVLNGADGFQTFLQQTGTIVPTLPRASTAFYLKDWDGDNVLDLIGLNRGVTGTGKLEIHIASGATQFKTWLFERGTAIPSADAGSPAWDYDVADWDKDGKLDIVGIKKNGTGTQKTEVHIVSGASEFQTFVVQTGTAFGQVPNEQWTFGMVDQPTACAATEYNFAQAPSWIAARYAGLGSRVNYYVTKPQASLQVDESWLVTYPLPNGRMIAHTYDHSGNRTTFYSDGEYADFSQTPPQQYRSAKNQADANGLSAAAPKTAYRYTALNNGHLANVRDEWGRSTNYVWDESNATLTSVDMLLQDDADTNSWARQIKYTYAIANNQWVATSVSFNTYNGRGRAAADRINRITTLSYRVGANGATLLETVKRPSRQGSVDGLRTTTYAYDTSNRVTSATTDGEVKVTYDYSSANDNQGADGAKVVMTQGDKQTTYEYTAQGSLRNKYVKDANVFGGSTCELNAACLGAPYTLLRWTQYWYDPAGRVVALNLPSGEQHQYLYDHHGNQLQDSTYAAPQTWADPAPAGATRSVKTTYNLDNQPLSIITPALSGKTSHPIDLAQQASYNYQDLKHLLGYETYKASAENQTFQSLFHSIDNVHVGLPVRWGVHRYFDDSGRLTRQERQGVGIQTTSYTYKPVGSTNRNVVADASGDPDWATARTLRTYGDQIEASDRDGQTEEYAYNEYGDTIWTLAGNAFVSDWNGTAPHQKVRQSLATYNGFGQQTWQFVYSHTLNQQDGLPETKRGWTYHSSGELDASWDTTLTNITDYQYAPAGTSEAGYLKAKISGLGSGGDVTTARQSASYRYDTYGRLSASVLNGFTTQYGYDTLDRQAYVKRPDGSEIRREYRGPTADLYNEWVRDGATNVVTNTFWDYDSLGRNYRVVYSGLGVVDRVFDPYGQPIRSQDSRLTMNTVGENQATYSVYDEQGNLLKQLSPALVTAAGQPYIDARRPYTEFAYDMYNRLTTTKVLLSGTVADPNDLKMPGTDIAVTTKSYDGFDRMISTTDPRGYTQSLAYDAAGHLISSTRQVWKGGESYRSQVDTGQGSATVTSYFGYTNAGQLQYTRNPDGGVNRTLYNLFGLPTAEVGADNRVAKVLQYTDDGLLQSTYLPNALDATTAYGAVNLNAPSGYTRMEYNTYTTSRSPSAVNRAYQNTEASATTGTTTGYTYDDQGRPLTITYPASATNERRVETFAYNAAGLITDHVTPDGVRTTTTYNSNGQPLITLVKAFDAEAVAVAQSAGLSAGLTTTRQYDEAGNLKSLTSAGMQSRYFSNALGKVIGKARPTAVGDTLAANNSLRASTDITTLTYRLDGQRADATHTADENGNVKSSTSLSGGTNQYFYDGLNRKYARLFDGSSFVYTTQVNSTGESTGSANYFSFLKYNGSGNITEAWDTPAYSDKTFINSAFKNNYVTTSYDTVGRISSTSRAIKLRPELRDPSETTSTLLKSKDFSDSDTITYNGRGQVVSDTLKNVNKTFYIDGRLKNDINPSDVNLTPTYFYDERGRLSKTTYPNGTTAFTNISIAYYPGGRKVKNNTYNYDTTVSTLEGREYKTVGTLASSSAVVDNDTQAIYTYYDSYGRRSRVEQPLIVGTDSNGNAYNWRPTTFYRYDTFGTLARVESSYKGKSTFWYLGYNYYDVKVSEGATSSMGELNTSAPADLPTLQQLSNPINNSTAPVVYRYDAEDRLTSTLNQNLPLMATCTTICDDVQQSSTKTIYNLADQPIFTLNGSYGYHSVWISNGSYLQVTRTESYSSGAPIYIGETVMATSKDLEAFRQASGADAEFGAPVVSLQAPVTALSTRLRINPASVTEDTLTLPRLDPDKVTLDDSAAPSESIQTTGVAPLATSGSRTLPSPEDVTLETAPNSSVGVHILPPGSSLDLTHDARLTSSKRPQHPVMTNIQRVAAQATPAQRDGLNHLAIYLLSRNPDAGLRGSTAQDDAASVITLATRAQASASGTDNTSTARSDFINAGYSRCSGSNKMEACRNAVDTIAKRVGSLESSRNEAIVLGMYTSDLVSGFLTAGDLLKLSSRNSETNYIYKNDSDRARGFLFAGAQLALANINSPAAALEDFAKGVGNSTLDVIGFTDAYDAVTGNDLHTGAPLTAWQRTGHGAMTVVNVGLMFIPGGKSANAVKAGVVEGRALVADTRVTREAVEELVGAGCKTLHSFAPNTLVRTATGLLAIGSLTLGTSVLAFNEQTGKNEYDPVTHIFKNVDPAITYLTLKDGQTGQPEAITTTPEHPFYVQAQADTQLRPKPVGHEELNTHWVGAGHLQIGDKIKQADGGMGVVANVVTVRQTQTMFNLTVDEAHTFYVGEKGWLVHNASDNKFGFKLQTNTGMLNDFAGKGFHLNSVRLGEIKISFIEGEMVARSLAGIELSSRESKALRVWLSTNSESVISQLQAALTHTAPIVSEDGNIIQTLTGTNLRNVSKSRSGAEALIRGLVDGCL
jgi:YD repeat-containing protein